MIEDCVDVASEGSMMYVYLCQAHVSALAYPGDSGSPIFEYLSSGSVRLIGILRGGRVGEYYSVSPLGSIRYEIGFFSTM